MPQTLPSKPDLIREKLPARKGNIAGRYTITNDLTSYDPSGLDVTADGKTLATVQEESSLGVWVMPAEGNATPKAHQLGLAKNQRPYVDWTPDGRLLTYSGFDYQLQPLGGRARATVYQQPS